MNTTHEKPNHDDVTHIVDGRTESVFTPREYEQRQRELHDVRMRQRFIKGPISVPLDGKGIQPDPISRKVCRRAVLSARVVPQRRVQNRACSDSRNK